MYRLKRANKTASRKKTLVTDLLLTRVAPAIRGQGATRKVPVPRRPPTMSPTRRKISLEVRYGHHFQLFTFWPAHCPARAFETASTFPPGASCCRKQQNISRASSTYVKINGHVRSIAGRRSGAGGRVGVGFEPKHGSVIASTAAVVLAARLRC